MVVAYVDTKRCEAFKYIQYYGGSWLSVWLARLWPKITVATLSMCSVASIDNNRCFRRLVSMSKGIASA